MHIPKRKGEKKKMGVFPTVWSHMYVTPSVQQEGLSLKTHK